MVAHGPLGTVTGQDSLRLEWTRGGQWRVTCVAAEVEDPGVAGRAYAEVRGEQHYEACPPGAAWDMGECRCMAGLTSPDPAAVACVAVPDAGHPRDAAVADAARADAAVRPVDGGNHDAADAGTAVTPAGNGGDSAAQRCHCDAADATGFPAGALLLAAVAGLRRWRKNGRANDVTQAA